MTVIDPDERPQILLIDDDQKLTRLLSGFLQAQGFAVTVAHDGAQGLLRAKEATWDLVILDVMLPRIDGFEVLTQLRRHSQIPVLMLTGRGGEDDMVAGLEGGADEYVAKTASSRELVTRIRALLRRAFISGAEVPESDNVLDTEAVFGTLRIVPAARAVYVEGEAVHLTNVEYELLVSLARYPGQVRSREQLLKDIRNRELAAFDRSVDVHIASLRKKLGDDSRSGRFIRTIRAAGYMLILEAGVT
jgi:DNA-binding response OmpR family regulator